MDRIAFIYGETFVYWNSIMLTLAAASAACFFLAFYLRKGGSAAAGALAVPMSMVLGAVLARLIHWYCRADAYESFFSAMTDYSSGGYALMGVFAGCFLTAAVLRLLRLSRSLPEMLDAMCLGGSAGIALGRLACFFNASDRGQIMDGMTELPWVWPVVNTVSGALEYRLATFVIQAMVTGLIFLGLAVFFLADRQDKRRKGDLTYIFLLCYGASQVVLDSTRYDSLFFRSNGFVSIVQVLGALAIGLACVVFSLRMVKARGYRHWQIPLWVLFAALVGCAGYMEYYVQRHGDQAVLTYSVMSACLIGLVLVVLVIRLLAVTAESKTTENAM